MRAIRGFAPAGAPLWDSIIHQLAMSVPMQAMPAPMPSVDQSFSPADFGSRTTAAAVTAPQFLDSFGLSCDQWRGMSHAQKYDLYWRTFFNPGPDFGGIPNLDASKQSAANDAIALIDNYCIPPVFRSNAILFGLPMIPRPIYDSSSLVPLTPTVTPIAPAMPGTNHHPFFSPQMPSAPTYLSWLQMSCGQWNTKSDQEKYNLVTSLYANTTNVKYAPGISIAQVAAMAVASINDYCAPPLFKTDSAGNNALRRMSFGLFL